MLLIRKTVFKLLHLCLFTILLSAGSNAVAQVKGDPKDPKNNNQQNNPAGNSNLGQNNQDPLQPPPVNPGQPKNNNTPPLPPQPLDTTVRGNDSLHYPIHDRRGDYLFGGRRGAYDWGSPSNFTDSVVYDPISRRYIIYEKIGNRYYRTPTTYSYEEFWALRNRQAENEYFRKRANTTSILNRGKFVKPKLSLADNFFNRLFGNGKIEITPQAIHPGTRNSSHNGAVSRYSPAAHSTVRMRQRKCDSCHVLAASPFFTRSRRGSAPIG